MTSPTSSLTVTTPARLPDSSALPPCSPSGCCGRCPSEPATDATTAVSNESANERSRNDFSANTHDGSDWITPVSKVLTIHPDNRGNVRETFRASWFPNLPPIVQLVRSESEPRTIRAMHRHLVQWDVWHFVAGYALVRTFDHKTGTDHYQFATPSTTIAIPPGMSHGFYTPKGCILLYGLTAEYDGSDEYGWYFGDGIDPKAEFSDEWPTDPTGLNISLRDLGAARLSEFRA